MHGQARVHVGVHISLCMSICLLLNKFPLLVENTEEISDSQVFSPNPQYVHFPENNNQGKKD
jgi:hypothetical protein